MTRKGDSAFMPKRERTIRIVLLKDCPLGAGGVSMRIGESQGLRACVRGWARVADPWRPPVRKPLVDVQKHA